MNNHNTIEREILAWCKTLSNQTLNAVIDKFTTYGASFPQPQFFILKQASFERNRRRGFIDLIGWKHLVEEFEDKRTHHGMTGFKGPGDDVDYAINFLNRKRHLLRPDDVIEIGLSRPIKKEPSKESKPFYGDIISFESLKEAQEWLNNFCNLCKDTTYAIHMRIKGTAGK